MTRGGGIATTGGGAMGSSVTTDETREVDVRRFQAASGYYEVVIDVEHSTDNVPAFLAGNRTLFVAAGNVDVSVDLAALGNGAVTVDQSRTSATITLPKPVLAPARLDLKRSYVYSEEQGVVARVQHEVGGRLDEPQLAQVAAERRGRRARRRVLDDAARRERVAHVEHPGGLAPRPLHRRPVPRRHQRAEP